MAVGDDPEHGIAVYNAWMANFLAAEARRQAYVSRSVSKSHLAATGGELHREHASEQTTSANSFGILPFEVASGSGACCKSEQNRI
jgi:hypothetical protein